PLSPKLDIVTIAGAGYRLTVNFAVNVEWKFRRIKKNRIYGSCLSVIFCIHQNNPAAYLRSRVVFFGRVTLSIVRLHL
ncbi:MAG TPA: hypothetical protein VN369_00510, partial [Terriglobales bacterium]|nr:hypothetical protein [Terriglobales bacterium]